MVQSNARILTAGHIVQSYFRMFQALKRPCCTNGTTFSANYFRVAWSLKSLKKSSNSIGPCDQQLLQEIHFTNLTSRIRQLKSICCLEKADCFISLPVRKYRELLLSPRCWHGRHTLKFYMTKILMWWTRFCQASYRVHGQVLFKSSCNPMKTSGLRYISTLYLNLIKLLRHLNIFFQSRSGSASSPELQSGGYSDSADGTRSKSHLHIHTFIFMQNFYWIVIFGMLVTAVHQEQNLFSKSSWTNYITTLYLFKK